MALGFHPFPLARPLSSPSPKITKKWCFLQAVHRFHRWWLETRCAYSPWKLVRKNQRLGYWYLDSCPLEVLSNTYMKGIHILTCIYLTIYIIYISPIIYKYISSHMCVYVFFLYPYLKELLGHGYKEMANGESLKALLVCQQFFMKDGPVQSHSSNIELRNWYHINCYGFHTNHMLGYQQKKSLRLQLFSWESKKPTLAATPTQGKRVLFRGYSMWWSDGY